MYILNALIGMHPFEKRSDKERRARVLFFIGVICGITEATRVKRGCRKLLIDFPSL